MSGLLLLICNRDTYQQLKLPVWCVVSTVRLVRFLHNSKMIAQFDLITLEYLDAYWHDRWHWLGRDRRLIQIPDFSDGQGGV